MKIDTKLNEKSGIYMITNTKSNKRYIGSSKNLYIRLLTHRRLLLKNNHYNNHLQNSFNANIIEDFIISVLEFCEEENLIKREQFFIDMLKPEFNIVTEVLEKGVIGKKIHQYSLNGEYIKSYDYIVDACRENNIHQSTICRFLNGTYKKGGDYLWSLELKEKLTPYIKPKRNLSKLYNSVIVTNIETSEILTFDSLKECANYFGMFPSEISKGIKTKRKFKRKFIIEKAALNSNI